MIGGKPSIRTAIGWKSFDASATLDRKGERLGEVQITILLQEDVVLAIDLLQARLI